MCKRKHFHRKLDTESINCNRLTKQLESKPLILKVYPSTVYNKQNVSDILEQFSVILITVSGYKVRNRLSSIYERPKGFVT